MAVDFDTIVNQTLIRVYGRAVTVRPLVSQPGGLAFQVTGIFDRHHQIILEEIRASEENGPGHSTTAPVLSVRLAPFAAAPKQGDEIVIGSETFLVWDVQPDGQGMADLILRAKV